MFNLIIEKCPEVVNISGHYLDIATDFKDILKILDIIESAEDLQYASYNALNRFFKGNVPGDMETALEVFKQFMSMDPNQINVDEDETEDSTPTSLDSDEDEEEDEQFFSIVYDSNYIYAAFLQVYGIDLAQVNMHWWRFKSLIKGLPSGTKLSEIIEVRSQELPKDSKSRMIVSRLKEVYKLPTKDKHDEKQAENALDALFNWAKS